LAFADPLETTAAAKNCNATNLNATGQMTTLESPVFAIIEMGAPRGAVWAVALGLVAGMTSMAIYHHFSPQEKIRQLKHRLNSVQRELASYDGDFAGAMALTKQNVGLSLRRLGLAVGPAVASGLPVLAFLPLAGACFVVYFIAVAISALTVKYVWNIA
jgi:hypothetical protein